MTPKSDTWEQEQKAEQQNTIVPTAITERLEEQNNNIYHHRNDLSIGIEA